MRKVSNIYFDDALYRDQIALHDIHLMAGRKHELHLCSFPEAPFDDLKVEVQGNILVERKDDLLIVDVPGIREKVTAYLLLSSPTGGFREKFLLHLFPAFSYEDRIGLYVNERNKEQRIALLPDGRVEIETADLVDDLPLFRFENAKLDPLSLSLRLPIGPYEDQEGTQFQLLPNILFDASEKALHAAFFLEAYQEGLSDSAYLCGEGDEDGIVSYDRFLPAERNSL